MTKAKRGDFFLSAMVDFPDDCLSRDYTREKIGQMMAALAALGIRRVFWIYCGGKNDGLLYDEKRLFWNPEGRRRVKQCFETVDRPLEVAVPAAKENGMEIYAVIKPYETGLSFTVPEGSPEAGLFPQVERIGGYVPVVYNFTARHPDMRIERRMDNIPANIDSIPIQTVVLMKNDEHPTRIKKENIEIWTSPNNYKYTRKRVDFSFREAVVDNPEEIRDHQGNVIVKAQQAVRTITLSGLALTDRFILITTNLTGPGDFQNIPVRLMKAYGPANQNVPIVVATSHCLGNASRNFKDYGLDFDTGFGDRDLCLDEDSSGGAAGFIAFARGVNRYLPGALCEAYPEVREYFKNQVREVLAMGVDGVDIRISAHSCHTDDDHCAYGFNKPIMDAYKKQYGVEATGKDLDLKKLADIRSAIFSDFMRDLSFMVRQDKKKFGFSINQEFMRDTPVALEPPDCVVKAVFPYCQRIQRPWNIDFNWKDWIKNGLLDFVCLRNHITSPDFHLNDDFTHSVLKEAKQRGLETIYVRYVDHAGYRSPAGSPQNLMREMDLLYNDPRINSLQLYEVANFTELDAKGRVRCCEPFAEMIKNW